MRRKIIKQGHNTLTVTLPSDWTKQLNLKAGDEVDISNNENRLVLSAEKHQDQTCSEINISNLDIPTIWKYFMAAYREGYDRLKVVYDPNEKFDNPYKFYTKHRTDRKYVSKNTKINSTELIHNITTRFIGFEVIEHKQNYCVIKDMAQASPKEFDNSLRRVFLLIQQMAEEMVQAIKTKNTKLVQHTHDIDINVDKFHDYCIRVLNKTAYKDSKKTSLLFSTLYILELIGDEFKDVAAHLLNDVKEKDLENLVHISQTILNEINSFYDLFYSFTKEKAMNLSKNDMEIYFNFPSLSGKENIFKTFEEFEVFNHFRRINRLINALQELRIEMEVKPLEYIQNI